MKLNITPDGENTKIAVFRTESENNGRKMRKQKTYSVAPTQKNAEILEKILMDIYEHLPMYQALHNSENKDILLTKLKAKFNLSIVSDEYIARNFEELAEIARAFVFNMHSGKEPDTIFNTYDFSDTDVLAILLGTFGYGKTTLTKKMLGFPDKYTFPLVDKGRTTINQCIYRALLLSEEEQRQHKYKNLITFYSAKELISMMIPNILVSFKEYLEQKSKRGFDTLEKQRQILLRFIDDSKAKLDEVFGDIEEFLQLTEDKEDHFYFQLLRFYKEFLDEAKKTYPEFNDYREEIYEMFKRGLDKPTTEMEKTFINNLRSMLKQKIQLAIDLTNTEIKMVFAKKKPTLPEKDIPLLEWDSQNKNRLIFFLEYDSLGSIDVYYRYFTSNNNKYRGSLVRILIKEVYTEFRLQSIYSTPFLGKYSSFVFIDTMGASHGKQKAEEKDNISYEITNKLPLLREVDAIVLLDKASEAMEEGTGNLLASLFAYSLHKKTILAYSFYDYFLKNDLKNDTEREQQLMKYLHDRINSLDSKVSKERREEFFKQMTKDNSRIVYLKGLVRYQNKEKTETSNHEDRVDDLFLDFADTTPEIDIDKVLNEYKNPEFNGITCIENLLTGITRIKSVRVEMDKMFRNSNLKIDYDRMDIPLLYNTFAKDYLGKEYNIYISNRPRYNTLEALCRRIKNDEEGFSGVNRELWPLSDALGIFSKNLLSFFENFVRIASRKNDQDLPVDKGLECDFVKDVIYQKMFAKIENYFRELLFDMNIDRWEELYYANMNANELGRAIYELIHLIFETKKSIDDEEHIIDWYDKIDEMLKNSIEEFRAIYDRQ